MDASSEPQVGRVDRAVADEPRAAIAALLRHALALASARLGADHVSVLELQPDGKTLTLLTAVPRDGERTSAVLSAGPDSPPGLAVTSGAFVLVEDWRAEDRLQMPQLTRALGARSGAAIPLESGAGPCGVLWAQSRQARRYSADELDYLAALAEVLALALALRTTVEAAERASLFDRATGLPGRELFLDRLRQALARGPRPGSAVAVLLLELDSPGRDESGLDMHAGVPLEAVAAATRGVLQAPDTLARLGPDRLAIVCEGLSGEGAAKEIGERIAATLRALGSPEERPPTAGIGIALATDHAHEPGALLGQAEAAMQRAREEGGARHMLLHERRTSGRAAGSVPLELTLRRALKERQLLLLYQPIVSLEGGDMVAVEALLRWEHPTRGLVTAADFLQVAEDSGVIVPIGAWAIDEVCHQAAAWQSVLGPAHPIQVTVNLSAAQMVEPELPDLVEGVLGETGIAPSQVGLEVDEADLLDRERMPVLQRIRSLGVDVLLDDFGSGRWSPDSLAALAVDAVKIDRGLVSLLGRNEDPPRSFEALTAAAVSLGIAPIALGVETAAQALQARQLGCELGQGYHFARPMTAAAIERELTQEPAVRPSRRFRGRRRNGEDPAGA